MVSSFPKFNVEYVTKLLAVFEKEGIITRISKGIYVKAQKTQFGILYLTAAEIVAEVAKRDHAMILPTGETAEYARILNPGSDEIMLPDIGHNP